MTPILLVSAGLAITIGATVNALMQPSPDPAVVGVCIVFVVFNVALAIDTFRKQWRGR